jgi:hypothetical protein
LENNLVSAYRSNFVRQTGATAVEFAIVAGVLFVFIFGLLEVIRSVYVINTIQEVTRRAASGAAGTDFRDSGAMDAVLRDAVLSNSGQLPLGDPITSQDVRIDYMALIRNPDGSLRLHEIAKADLPTCRQQNLLTCTANQNDPSCIRFVRARICDHADQAGCSPVHYKTVFSLGTFPLDLPPAVTVVPAESLGYVSGSPGCP